jgi:hypothetical protein
MANIFEVIGKHIEKRKKEKEIFRNNYWKLSAVERIDYDNKVNKIKEETDYGIFPISFVCIKILLFVTLTHLFFYYMNILDFLELTTSLLMGLVSILIFTIFIDYFFLLFFSFNRTKRIKELNKRFKI